PRRQCRARRACRSRAHHPAHVPHPASRSDAGDVQAVAERHLLRRRRAAGGATFSIAAVLTGHEGWFMTRARTTAFLLVWILASALPAAAEPPKLVVVLGVGQIRNHHIHA